MCMSHFADLNQCDFWLWVYVKNVVCYERIENLADLKASITHLTHTPPICCGACRFALHISNGTRWREYRTTYALIISKMFVPWSSFFFFCIITVNAYFCLFAYKLLVKSLNSIVSFYLRMFLYLESSFGLSLDISMRTPSISIIWNYFFHSSNKIPLDHDCSAKISGHLKRSFKNIDFWNRKFNYNDHILCTHWIAFNKKTGGGFFCQGYLRGWQ